LFGTIVWLVPEKKELQKHIAKHSIDIDIVLKLKCILRFLVMGTVILYNQTFINMKVLLLFFLAGGLA
jgi:hypothetical protein